jgi:hypothetical protein
MSSNTPDGKFGLGGELVRCWKVLRAEWQRYQKSQDPKDRTGSRSEVHVIKAERPDLAYELKLRLEAPELHRAAVLKHDKLLMRNLERICATCDSKTQCSRDWIVHPNDSVWRSYCSNAPALDALKRTLDGSLT